VVVGVGQEAADEEPLGGAADSGIVVEEAAVEVVPEGVVSVLAGAVWEDGVEIRTSHGQVDLGEEVDGTGMTYGVFLFQLDGITIVKYQLADSQQKCFNPLAS